MTIWHNPDHPHHPTSLPEVWELARQTEIRAHRVDRDTGRPASWHDWRPRFIWTRDHDVPQGQELWRSATTLSPAPSPGPTPLIGSDGLRSLPPEGSFWPPAGFTLIEAWSQEPYRLVWTHSEIRAVLTYCEGDLTMLTCLNAETWRVVRREHAAFYRDH